MLRSLVREAEKRNIVSHIIQSLRRYWTENRLCRTDRLAKPLIDEIIASLIEQEHLPLFRFIEIETISRCNGGCSFCPVNRDNDPRPLRKMDNDLFLNIIEQLGDLQYEGTLSLYGNNEPLLDKRIFEFATLTRERVPRARLCMFTNGTLLTIDAFKRLISVLDRLVIDNYSDTLTMHPNIREVADYWRDSQVPDKEVQIIVRRETEVLTSRAGAAPNRKEIPPIQSSCLLPFTQMAVRPNGELGRCCADALGTKILGDLSRQSILDAWHSEAYRKFRRRLQQGRQYDEMCIKCDMFVGPNYPKLNALPAYCSLEG